MTDHVSTTGRPNKEQSVQRGNVFIAVTLPNWHSSYEPSKGMTPLQFPELVHALQGPWARQESATPTDLSVTFLIHIQVPWSLKSGHPPHSPAAKPCADARSCPVPLPLPKPISPPLPRSLPSAGDTALLRPHPPEARWATCAFRLEIPALFLLLFLFSFGWAFMAVWYCGEGCWRSEYGAPLTPRAPWRRLPVHS